jgi:cytochrome c553
MVCFRVEHKLRQDKGKRMKKTSIVLLSAVALFALSGCGDAPKSSSEAKTYSKTPAEVYAQSCIKCHGKNAEGNVKKKGPALNDRQAGELELDLYDVKNGGTNQSSGTEHDIMEHNMQKLLAKGYDYDPKAMAEYLEKSFYKHEGKPAAPAAEASPAAEETPTAAAH